MAEASGSLAQITYVDEVTWGVTPGTPSMKKLGAALYGEGLAAEIEEIQSQAISSSRSVQAARGGKISVGGSIPIELPINGIGGMLKHALGSVSTSGAGPYTHTIKRGALPAGFTVEKGFTDIAQYFVHTGCKVDQLSIAIAATGIVTGSLDVLAKDITASGTTLGAPSSVTHSPVVSHEATTVQEGGVAATVLGIDLNISNNHNADRFNVGSRYRASLVEGQGGATGTVTFLFEDLTHFNKWLNETGSSLKIIFTQGTETLEIFLPNIKYFGDGSAKIDTPQGIVLPLSFVAIYDGTELTDVKIVIVNSEVTI